MCEIETKDTNHRYIQKYMKLEDKTTGVPLISTATVFVSHAWRYAFYDVVVDVMEQYARKFPDAYFWFDLFLNDQNCVSTKDFDWFSTTFWNGVRQIGQGLLVLSAWNDPIPIKRAWCLFEIHNALQEANIELTIYLPSCEVQQLRSGVSEDHKCAVQALSDIQAEKAEAKTESDKMSIFEVIRTSEGGFSEVNRRVKDELRSWYIQQLKAVTNQEPGNYDLLEQIGVVIHKFGNVNEALSYHNSFLAVKQKTVGEDHQGVATSYNHIGIVYFSKGKYDKALEYYRKSLSIRLKVLGENHPDVATSYGSIATVYGPSKRVQI